MKIKISHIFSALSIISITQLLFFWLVPVDHSCFWVSYPFYTAITLANTLIAIRTGTVHGLPAAFAPIFVGAVLTAVEIATSLCMLFICSSPRTHLFVQLIITMIYVLASSVFVSIASNESANSMPQSPAVRPFDSNDTEPTTIRHAPDRRKPTPIDF